MDNQNITRNQMIQIQEIFLAILGAVYGSASPITPETIARQIKQPCTSEFVFALSGLVGTGHLSVQIEDGIVKYCKPTSVRAPTLPMPYHRMFDCF